MPPITKKQREQFKETISDYQNKNNIEVKCLSDKVMLYCRYVIDKFDELGLRPNGITAEEYNGQDYVNITHKEEFSRCVHKIYYDVVRGNMDFVGTSPKTLASGIIYIAGVMTGTNITQKNMAELLQSNTASIINIYKKMLPHLKDKDGWYRS